MVKKSKIIGPFILFITALIWGMSFVAQDVGMEKIEGFTFSAVRQLMGGILLLIFILVRDGIKGRKMTSDELVQRKKDNRKAVKCGLILGVVFFAATNLQQFAFNTSNGGKIAFITAFYMFFVAIISLFLGKKLPWLTWVGVAGGITGLYFLCIGPDGFGGITVGDGLSLGCALFFAIQILLIEKFAPEVDGIILSDVQFLFSGVVSTVLMFIFENPSLANIEAAAIPLLYSGIMSCGVAYTLQIVGQKYTEATLASLIMCLESVFAVISEAIILKNKMTGRETLGCVIMFCAIIIAQLAEKIQNKLFKKKAA